VPGVERTIIFDFDGTVCLGDGPALEYARGVADAHPSLADLEHRVARHLAGDALAEFVGAVDGYQAVQSAASAAGVDPARIEAAFRAARRRLAEEGLGVHAPAGFGAFARDLRERGVRMLLVTNAPGEGLDSILALLGIAACFDRIVADAGKPEGMHAVLDGIAGEVSTVLSIGDIWVNDLSVPHRRGAATALIDGHGNQPGTPDVRVRAMPDLYMWVQRWIEGATGA
jgi:FMN phosphatase YigB (HAD superfamily)